jgi:hypothetical protein
MSKKGSNPQVEEQAQAVTGPFDNVQEMRALIPDLVTITQNLKDASQNFLDGAKIIQATLSTVKVN